jgi:hypothetical protein
MHFYAVWYYLNDCSLIYHIIGANNPDNLSSNLQWTIIHWWLAFSTAHFNPGTSVSCVTLARTDGSFHLGKDVTIYLCKDIDLWNELRIFQYFVFVCILICHIVRPRLDCSVENSCIFRFQLPCSSLMGVSMWDCSQRWLVLWLLWVKWRWGNQLKLWGLRLWL